MSHVHQREFAQPVPLLVGREERRHPLFIAKRTRDELMKPEQRHIVRHLVVADEMVVFIAQHSEFENH